jgi:Uncharacterised protein conserved in bacteria (DUF2336)
MTKSSACSPLDGLVDLACRDGVEIRPTLLRVLTDLYVQKPSHSTEEETQYVELSLRLIEAVDAATRKTVFSRLSTYPNAPVAVLRRLIALDAEPGAGSKPANKPTAASVRQRDLAEEFFAANAGDRYLILTNLAVFDQPLPRRAAPAVSEVIRRLETAALQRNPGEFARMLERALGISHAIAERVTRDNSGEPLLVAAKALGMPVSVFQRILMFINPTIGLSVERVFELSRFYDEIELAAAERMVTIWREAATVRRPAQAPVYWDDPQRGALASATSAQHAAAPRRDTQTPRPKSGAS